MIDADCSMRHYFKEIIDIDRSVKVDKPTKTKIINMDLMFNVVSDIFIATLVLNSNVKDNYNAAY